MSEPPQKRTAEELMAAIRREHARFAKYVEIRARVSNLRERLGQARERGEAVAGGVDAAQTIERLAADAATLVDYLEVMLAENERLRVFLIGLEDAGTLEPYELEFILRPREE